MDFNLKGICKAKVLCALYNNAKYQGLSFASFDNSVMTEEDAKNLLNEQTSFDYLNGRILKVDLSGDVFNSWLYDRDNGTNAAELALGEILLLSK